mmetsp:Transcript_21492/g.32659  ORF Transcript_21492/g.32659 Transcript_21492/m.32659 type:complete len:155 (+) Transcript_21492:327-791(+)
MPFPWLNLFVAGDEMIAKLLEHLSSSCRILVCRLVLHFSLVVVPFELSSVLLTSLGLDLFLEICAGFNLPALLHMDPMNASESKGLPLVLPFVKHLLFSFTITVTLVSLVCILGLNKLPNSNLTHKHPEHEMLRIDLVAMFLLTIICNMQRMNL